MEIKQLTLEYLHKDHCQWIRELEFYQEEIQIFEHRLETIVGRTDNKEVLADVEHFQNQFIREKEVIDELKHDVKIQEREIGKLAANDHALDTDIQVRKHVAIGDKMLRFNEIFNELKQEFNQFYLKWMASDLE